MPDREDTAQFAERDTEKIESLPKPEPRRPSTGARRRRPTPHPLQDRFLETLAEKVERDSQRPGAASEESE